MPEINKIPEVLYQPNQPYHFHYDNLPLKNILERIDLVNAQVDISADILRGAAGSVGTLAARLSVSLEDDGTLSADAIDAALHSIEEHEDTDDFVRMTSAERDKLTNIASEANLLEIEVQSISTTSLFSAGAVRFRHSDTVTFEVIAPDILKAHSAFPSDAAHQHHYDLTPAHANILSPDYQNYLSTSLATPFIDESLRVYVNGIRLSASDQVRVPDADSAEVWTLTNVASTDAANGTFSLNRALVADDIIRIDFDEDFIT